MTEYKVKEAINLIEETYGHTVSVERKAKTLRKFGRNTSLGTTEETVWLTGGTETYQTDNNINIVTTNDASNNQAITIEGHTIDSNGDFTFITQDTTLNGTGIVELTTPLARANRLINNGSTNFSGAITVQVSGATTHVTADQFNQSLKAATTISKNDYWIITEVIVGVERQQTRSVDFKLQVREKGGVFRNQLELTANSNGGSIIIELDPVIIVRPNSDIRINATSSGTSTQAVATIGGYLAIIT